MTDEKKRFINPAEALRKLDEGKIICADTIDGHVEIERINRSNFETRVYTADQEEAHWLRGNMRDVLRILNREPFITALYLK